VKNNTYAVMIAILLLIVLVFFKLSEGGSSYPNSLSRPERGLTARY
jgi:hypothetical protein